MGAAHSQCSCYLQAPAGRGPEEGLVPSGMSPAPCTVKGTDTCSIAVCVCVEPMCCSVIGLFSAMDVSFKYIFWSICFSMCLQSLELTRKMLRDKQNKKNSGQRLPVFPSWVYERPALVGDFLTGSGLSTDTAVPIGL